MSWVTKIKSDLIIQTGDGKKYSPNWVNASKAIDYNVTEFDFPDIPGTLVRRTTPRGARYNLEIYFQGDNNLDISKAFEVSANDNRSWVISHPYYDNLTVQPTSLNFDNSVHNITKITGTVIETITEDYPKGAISPVDKITADKEALDATYAEVFANTVEPDTGDINLLSSNVESFFNKATNAVLKFNEEQASEYFNLYNQAKAAIFDATAAPLLAIITVNNLINYPASVQDSVKNRLAVLGSQFQVLRLGVVNMLNPSEKRIYQNNAGIIISSMLLASALPVDENDYGNRDNVFSVIETLLAAYDGYVSDLDSLQTANGGGLESFIPDFEPLLAINNLLTFTISNLFSIASNARQERIIYLEEDSNAILLTHRFYELSDATIEEFIRNNNIGLSENLVIKKGRKISYYI